MASKLTVRGVAMGVSIVRQMDTFSWPSPTGNTGWRNSTVTAKQREREREREREKERKREREGGRGREGERVSTIL